MSLLDVSHRYRLTKPFYRLFVEVILFALIGLFLGITISFIIPDITPDESLATTLGWIIAEVLIDACFVYLFDKVYFLLFGTDSDEYIGITIFGIILFSMQVQLYGRTRRLYTKVTGCPIYPV